MARLIAFVLGGGNTVWEDLAAAHRLAEPDLIIACNHAARDYPGRVDHWVTMHPELFPHWINLRAAAAREPAGQLWCAKHRHHYSKVGPVKQIASPGGSSGMLCVQVGLELGCTHMLLCGIPIHQNGRHYDRSIRWTEARQYLPAWERQLPIIRDRVRSFGGETARLLGPPTREWIDGTDP